VVGVDGSVSFFLLRPSSGLRSPSPRPRGRFKTHMAGRLRASAMPGRCFPAVRR
jgi:hypothetical protein